MTERTGIPVLTRDTSLVERERELSAEEARLYWHVQTTTPLTYEHVAAHGHWMEVRGRLLEVRRLLEVAR